MKLLRSPSAEGERARRGAALLLSFIVLIVIVAIVYQINIVTKTDARVARNDVTLTKMDLAIESSLLEIYEMLAVDGEAALSEDAGPGMPGDEGGPGELGGGGAPGGEGEGGAVDSRMDDWGRPQSTTINEIELRITIQDEDSKYNVLNMLAEDEEEAEAAFDRVARILDDCRDGTDADIDSADAEEMARVMLDHMRERTQSLLPRPLLLTDNPDDEDFGLPLTLREFVVIEPFREHHFRDYFDEDGVRIHSIGAFLTIWTAPFIGGGGGEEDDDEGDDDDESGLPFGDGGVAVNLNTAPLAVLANLLDDREVSSRFWEELLLYRNAEEESEDGEDEVEPIFDEFGEEVFRTQIFDDLEELDEVYGWSSMSPEVKTQLEDLLTVESRVFSIYVTARVLTQEEGARMDGFLTRREREEFERSGMHLARTVRSVVWRMESGGEIEIIPLVRWEVLDSAPLEVLDYPDDDY